MPAERLHPMSAAWLVAASVHMCMLPYVDASEGEEGTLVDAPAVLSSSCSARLLKYRWAHCLVSCVIWLSVIGTCIIDILLLMPASCVCQWHQDHPDSAGLSHYLQIARLTCLALADCRSSAVGFSGLPLAFGTIAYTWPHTCWSCFVSCVAS